MRSNCSTLDISFSLVRDSAWSRNVGVGASKVGPTQSIKAAPGGARSECHSQKKREIPLGEHSWLTVVSPEAPDGTELSLEPDEHPAARPFKQALVEDGIPFTSFAVDDVGAEYERLVALGVRFTQPPTDMGMVTTAVFDDTCGNLIQISAEKT
jgi:hypothetical protein